jgi:hypothetical protein
MSILHWNKGRGGRGGREGGDQTRAANEYGAMVGLGGEFHGSQSYCWPTNENTITQGPQGILGNNMGGKLEGQATAAAYNELQEDTECKSHNH